MARRFCLLFVQHPCDFSTVEQADGGLALYLNATLLETESGWGEALGHERRRRSSASLPGGGFEGLKLAMIDGLRRHSGTPWTALQAPSPAAAHPYRNYEECI